ncbi:helix-turn-helix domain-containing protein [Chryseobacterium jejuense]|uniref:helix-turn-helix domain-containing protein n=1 Tax=Chryseobacterium jejuense TaxID=445960 RepID=UPI001AE4193D|nr:helix-turn-helix domain-containing protein [Chryseobacterium jejuense]MBP2618851.1 DNA-binding transcriptional regulator YiaG [Chryseobacterium jejuense]
MNRPNYKKIYKDLIQQKYPEHLDECQKILSQKDLSFFDIIQLNSIISKNSQKQDRENQRFRSYDRSTIVEILEYQKKHNINNTELARYFKLSRNTVTKWKQYFLIS